MNENPIISLERAVHACFPPEQQQLQVVAARPYGASSRGRTARVTARLPDASLAHINQVSATTGKFGSDVPHYQAGFSFEPASYSYWADCFTSWITEIFDQDTAVNGQWPAYEAAFKDLICKTIPRLLLPLQENGRKIIPVLVHGNLSTNNLGIRLADGTPVLFSPCAAYAHQEFELGVSQLAIGGLDKTFVDQYLRMVLPSEPIDEVYHRIILYGVHFNLRLSASHAGQFRERIYTDMLFLNGMYAEN
ncbi:uncharacterized protein N7458_005964 [Penicillium daleae]|uniref:Protein-ribulosamine 3-kinase n=1 Tax=Penicillium daleae TaxID=63821 RepID=A0AAD6G2E7_9EURO|nr:uncharacterized protein N7458_005964 [Penicillium daleae]KAJ5449515.1 hypothetical protein N7458_005964 [Penicillium daleae]